LVLTEAEISVDASGLEYSLNIMELTDERDCDFQQAFCTQHWRVHINPMQCTLNGQFTARMTGACHEDADNCIEPSPNTADIVMDITSDDFCGVTQEVEIEGFLTIEETQCNGLLKGSIIVENSEDAAINYTRILKLRAEPTLVDSQFLTIYDESDNTALFGFVTSSPETNVVDFEFVWEGSELRCDVTAHLEVMVMVQFEATRPLLMSIGANGAKMLSDDDMKEETMRMLETTGFIATDSSSNPTDGGNTSEEGNTPPVAAEAASSSTTTIVVAALAGVLALSIVAVSVAVWKKRAAMKAAGAVAAPSAGAAMA